MVLKKTRWKIITFFLLSVALLFIGCGSNTTSSSQEPQEQQTSDDSNASADDVIKIGVIQPFSGPNAKAGEETYKGNELAVDEINADGGINGKKVVLVKGDATNAQQAISEVERLITEEKVDILTGTYLSAVAYAGTQVAFKNNVLWWETNALAPDITQQGYDNVIRIGMNDNTIASVAINAIKDVVAPALGKDVSDLKVVIVHEQNIYGTSIGQKEEEQLTALGTTVLNRIPYDPAAADLTDVVNKAREGNPDILLRTGYINDGILLYKTMRELGWKPSVIMGVSDESTYLLEGLGAETLEGILSICYPQYDMSENYAPGVRDFVQKYKEKYNTDPIMPQTLVSYGGTKILFDILKEVDSTDVQKIREKALQMDVPIGGTYPTGFGVKLDPKTLDNTRAYPVLAQWQDGKVVTIYPKEAVEGDKGIKLPLAGW